MLLRELLHVLGTLGVERDTDDYQAGGAVFLLQLDVAGYFLDTRSAPSGPKVDHEHLALELLRADLLSVEILELPCRSGLRRGHQVLCPQVAALKQSGSEGQGSGEAE